MQFFFLNAKSNTELASSSCQLLLVKIAYLAKNISSILLSVYCQKYYYCMLSTMLPRVILLHE